MTSSLDIVRRSQGYAWPGGYPVAALVDDGELLCFKCATDPTNPVHEGGEADGWRVDGYMILEGTEEDYDGSCLCAHCHTNLLA
jgi:hypothetical protein